MARTDLTRLREDARTDRADLDALLDSCVLGHFAAVAADGDPIVIPTAVVRVGDDVLAHGSTGSRWMRLLATGVPTCLAVTALDGILVARSAFESSLHYRSAVLFGRCATVSDPAAKRAALDAITERLLPGRTAEVREPRAAELAATLLLRLRIVEWSVKVSDGWPDDPADDVAGDAWAGTVALTHGYAEPRTAPDLRAGIDVPASVRALAAAEAHRLG